MFHEPSLPASTWPMMNGVPPGSRVADRVTVDSGSDLPEKSGWLTLVVSTVPVDRPLSDAGFSWPVRTIELSATVAVLSTVSLEPPTSSDEHLDRVSTRFPVPVVTPESA